MRHDCYIGDENEESGVHRVARNRLRVPELVLTARGRLRGFYDERVFDMFDAIWSDTNGDTWRMVSPTTRVLKSLFCAGLGKHSRPRGYYSGKQFLYSCLGASRLIRYKTLKIFEEWYVPDPRCIVMRRRMFIVRTLTPRIQAFTATELPLLEILRNNPRRLFRVVRRQYLSFDVAFVETRREHLHRSLMQVPNLFDHVETPEELRMTGGARVCEFTHDLRVYNIRLVSDATREEAEVHKLAAFHEKTLAETEDDRLTCLYLQSTGDVWTGQEVDGIGPARDEWGQRGVW